MDLFVIILIAVGIFGLALLASKAYSLFVVWKKASNHGLSIGLKEVIALAKFYELEDSFLDACRKFQALDKKIRLDEVVHHHMADGDTWGLLDKFTMIKNHGFDMTFKSAVLYDLSGKDLNDIIQKQLEVYKIAVNEKTTGGVHYMYMAQFKISADSTGWITPNLDDYQWRIAQKINHVLEHKVDMDFARIIPHILEKELNEPFWKELCHGKVINHDLKIIQ